MSCSGMVNGEGQVPSKKVKDEKDAEDVAEKTEENMESVYKTNSKRSATHNSPEAERGKKVKLTTQDEEHLDISSDDGSRSEPYRHRLSPQEQVDFSSYRKPLYSITHRISERKAASYTEQNGSHNGIKVNHNGVHPQKSGRKHHTFTSSPPAVGSPTVVDSQLYPLIEKMFFLLNTLNSSMTQLHSKVDLLSLEVTRIKKQMKPPELAMQFHPPPEYQLTSDELAQLMEQTSTAGELGCRLLVQLFPELFTAKECTHGCSATKRTLDSLHLQLIRSYVEVCYPLVKSENLWQTECLLQINDFLNRFWAQKDMESAQDPGSVGFDVVQNQDLQFDLDDAQEESLSLNSGEISDVPLINIKSESVLDTQDAADDSDDLTSPEELIIFLLNRLFPEVFEEGKLPEGHDSIGQLIIDSDRLEIIRKYMEANFPEVPEETWLQLCVQRMEEALENASTSSGLQETLPEMYDTTRLPDNISIMKISDLCDFEKPNRRSKKTWLEPVDFENLEMPHPDFHVPPECLLSREQLKNNYECSLSIGNFASRLLVLMFPELFTYENARKYYNCSGSLGKKQLDPVRINLIRHYVQLLYPRAKNDRVWTLEFVGKLDERCRRRDTDQRRSYQQQRKACSPDQDPELKESPPAGQPNTATPDGLKEELEVLPVPLEKSSKDFCKIPLENLSVTTPDFPVPSDYILTNTEVREIVQQSLSVGNFAARLLVRLFPELFTQDNLRLQYNHSGACNKKQLDPTRLRLIRHYVEAVYPVDKMEEVWHYECVPSIDERCRRPNRKKCDILKKAKRTYNTVTYS